MICGKAWCGSRGYSKYGGLCEYHWCGLTASERQQIRAAMSGHDGGDEGQPPPRPPDEYHTHNHQHIHPPVPLWLNVAAWGIGGAVGQILYQLAGLLLHRLGW